MRLSVDSSKLLKAFSSRDALDILRGTSKRNRLLTVLPFLGPAFIASVAYMDPGNFAANIQGGSLFGYKLLWVITISNLMAMLLQFLSAKLGIATGMNLAEVCRQRFSRPISISLWIIAEGAAMATDLAEFVGAAIGFHILLGISLVVAALLTGIVTFAILALQRFGFRPLEAIITALVGVIAIAYLIETLLARPDLGAIAYHALVPALDSKSIMIAVAMLGATVMPHVIYLHSALTQRRIIPRNDGEARRLLHFELIDIVIALGLAGIINAAMMYMAAAVFFNHGLTGISSIETAFQTLTPLLGPLAATAFAIALLASGISSSSVGTMAGQVVMEGFLGWTIPVWLRRLVTMAPALVVIGLGLNPTQTLILSQVILSFALPFATIPLVLFTSSKQVMGALVNRPSTTLAAITVVSIIIILNILLLLQTFGLSF
jgi:manganese transport protein